LDWYKTERSKIAFKPKQIQLHKKIVEIVNLFEPIAKKKSISIKYVYNSSMTAFADRNMFDSILRNLLSNAIKYTNENGEIIIETQLHNDCTEVSIKDNGIGMDENTIKKLYQLTATKSKRGTAHEKGTGLGLLICKEFIEEHQGQLSIESNPGEGSTFSFTLPNKK
jgi:signal transduction histidine kinase